MPCQFVQRTGTAYALSSGGKDLKHQHDNGVPAEESLLVKAVANPATKLLAVPTGEQTPRPCSKHQSLL